MQDQCGGVEGGVRAGAILAIPHGSEITIAYPGEFSFQDDDCIPFAIVATPQAESLSACSPGGRSSAA